LVNTYDRFKNIPESLKEDASFPQIRDLFSKFLTKPVYKGEFGTPPEPTSGLSQNKIHNVRDAHLHYKKVMTELGSLDDYLCSCYKTYSNIHVHGNDKEMVQEIL
jgi:hypothetical protein